MAAPPVASIPFENLTVDFPLYPGPLPAQEREDFGFLPAKNPIAQDNRMNEKSLAFTMSYVLIFVPIWKLCD
jgi:hypothetical protein